MSDERVVKSWLVVVDVRALLAFIGTVLASIITAWASYYDNRPQPGGQPSAYDLSLLLQREAQVRQERDSLKAALYECRNRDGSAEQRTSEIGWLRGTKGPRVINNSGNSGNAWYRQSPEVQQGE